MPASKIVDEAEVLRWFEEGKTYAEMSEIYREKYNIETVPSLWGNYRRRKGLARRINRDDELIPWEVKREHRWRYPLAMLRAEARRREGMELPERQGKRLDTWLEQMREADAVVHYEPDTEEGFFAVPRRPGIDTDLIRRIESQAVLGRRRAD